MNNQQSNNHLEQPAKTPSYKALYAVDDIKKGQENGSSYTKVGVAFLNKDGSFLLSMNAVPMGGRILMRDPWTRENNKGNQNQNYNGNSNGNAHKKAA
ncbi:MAG: hypothetical protein GY822_08590 [Deltaproteobacteria bacterium]|nr:hypothetical protein [Deltaproteobacteria bacterium]